MNKFDSVDALWTDALGVLLSEGRSLDSRAGRCDQVLAYQSTLMNIDRTFLLNPVRHLSPTYASAELLWYLAGTRDVTMIAAYAPSYYSFAEGSEAWGAYGARWLEDVSFIRESQDGSQSQLTMLIELLDQADHSRQAVMTMWNAGDLPHAVKGDHKDLPCTLSWQFLVDERRLHMICTMRSSDVWLGLPYDVFVNTCIQRLVAQSLGLSMGTYTHQSGSLHLYERNQQAATEAIGPRVTAYARQRSAVYCHNANPRIDSGWAALDSEQLRFDIAVSSALNFERAFRLGHVDDLLDQLERLNRDCGRRNPLHDAAVLCASKWEPVHRDRISSALMKEAYDNVR